MKRKSVVAALVAMLVLTAGWSFPSKAYRNVYAAQEKDEQPVSLKITSAPIEIEVGSSFDAKDMVVSGRFDTLDLPIVNTSKVGEFEVTFKATKGLESIKIVKKVVVKDTVAPVFVEKVDKVTLEFEETKDVKALFAASDNLDGELEVVIEGTFDSAKAGNYDLTAVAKDKSNNEVRHPFVVEVKEKPAPVVTPTASSSSSSSSSDAYSGGSIALTSSSGSSNTYGAGWCTWWVQERRIQSGNGLSNHLGDAITWYDYAADMGYPVGHTPVSGAAVQFPGINHVAYVEAVYADGSILISEMGWNYTQYGYNERVIDASRASSLNYIY